MFVERTLRVRTKELAQIWKEMNIRVLVKYHLPDLSVKFQFHVQLMESHLVGRVEFVSTF